MKQLYVIRHGETDFNKSHQMQGRGIDASINATGRMQAEAVADYLQIKPISLVVTSSLKRTLETAQPVIENHGARTESYKDLDEMSFGDLEGKVFQDVTEEIKELHRQWSNGDTKVPTPNGESPEEVFARAGKKVKEILQRVEEEHIVLMLHGRLIRILLSVWLGYGLKNMHKVEHANGAVNHLEWDGKKFKAHALNITDHLKETVKD